MQSYSTGTTELIYAWVVNFVKARNFVHLVMTGNGAKCKCSDMHLTKCNLEAAESVCHPNGPCGGGAWVVGRSLHPWIMKVEKWKLCQLPAVILHKLNLSTSKGTHAIHHCLQQLLCCTAGRWWSAGRSGCICPRSRMVSSSPTQLFLSLVNNVTSGDLDADVYLVWQCKLQLGCQFSSWLHEIPY